MKGKKTDTEFISDFISQCVMQGLDTPESIVAHAQEMINGIDEEIKLVEKKKITRSKLLDVVSSFGKEQKSNKSEEIRALSFFKLQHPAICQHICNRLKVGPLDIIGLEHGASYSQPDVVFCVKQLLESKVISKTGKYFLRGEHFNDYMKFVFKEV